jgi:hypothetical protein
MKIEILMSPSCGCKPEAVMELVRGVTAVEAPDADIETVEVGSIERVLQLRFVGSPSIRVNGVDVDPYTPRAVSFG